MAAAVPQKSEAGFDGSASINKPINLDQDSDFVESEDPRTDTRQANEDTRTAKHTELDKVNFKGSKNM